MAQRKVASLLKAGAAVTVVSTVLSPRLRRYSEARKICYINSRYKQKFLKGVFLVIAATDDVEINSRIFFDAEKKGILINCVDAPAQSNFIVPAVCENKGLIFSVSTSGKAPGFARKIKQDLKEGPVADYSLRLEIIHRVRRKIKHSYSLREKKKIISRLSELSYEQLLSDPEVKKFLT